mgnify:CR=1 FL=1
MKLAVHNSSGEQVGEVEFAEDSLLREGEEHLVHDAVVAHRRAARAGTASTRTRAQVIASGAKP